jgi:hypothetical protein
MTLKDAESICASQAADAWAHVKAHPQSFIWSDDEEPASSWNRLFGAELGTVAVNPIASREGSLQFSFRERVVEVQLKFNRDDRFRVLHGLARVVRPESDLRLCRDSTHSSDVAFFAVPLAEWSGLESRFGADTVAARFLPMDTSFDEFFAAAFPVPDAPRGALSSDLTDWDGGGSYQPAKLEYTLVYDGPGHLRLEALRTIVHRYLEAGTVTVSFWRMPSMLEIDRDDMVEKVADRIGQLQIRVSNLSRTGFVVVESNGVAAGWRTDGWLPPNDAPGRKWLFWKRRDKCS